MGEKFVAEIRIENLTKPQMIALEDLLSIWQSLGSWGSSRWTAFYADGDGDFRPKVTFNGKKPESSPLAGGPSSRWKQEFGERDVYVIDFDSIGWALHNVGPLAERKEG